MAAVRAIVVGVERPPSYSDEHMTGWSMWALEHGLPELPVMLNDGESVPVARWIGPRFAAVMHVRRRRRVEHHVPGEVDNDIELFIRRSNEWDMASGSGGSSWYEPPLMRPDALGAEDVWFGGEVGAGEEDWFACALDGLAGASASVVELEDAGGMTSMPLESPIGAFVVAVDAAHPASVRVRRSDGAVLGSAQFAEWRWEPQ